MTRIEEEASKRFPCTELGPKGMIDSNRRKYFIEGAKWLEENPTINTIYNIEYLTLDDEDLKQLYNSAWNLYLDIQMELYKRKIPI